MSTPFDATEPTRPLPHAPLEGHAADAGVNVSGAVVAVLGILVALACALTLGGVNLPSITVSAVIVVAVLACTAGVLVRVRGRSR